MSISRSASFSFLVLAVAAQAQAPAHEQRAAPAAAAIAISRSAGLHGDGDGLLGFGARYRARFTRAGLRFEPALGAAVDVTQHLALTPVAVRRGEAVVCALPSAARSERHGLVAKYAHAPGVLERFEVGPEGVALSWLFERRPAGSGDLVVRYAVDTSLPAPTRAADGGLVFARPGIGGVTIGGVTGIDATGARFPGELRFEAGHVELVLPQACVEEAAYPLVLDPLIGTTLYLSPGSLASYFEPDAAYDATTDRWLVVYRLYLSSTSVDLLGQRLNGDGTLAGSLTPIATGVDAGRPRVANLSTRDRFGIVWRQQNAVGVSIRFAAVSAVAGGPTHSLTVASSFGGDLLDPDIGADTHAPIGSNRGFVVVYDDGALGAIRARRIYFSSNDQLISPSATSVFTDSVLASYSQPAISRAGASVNDLLVVARRFTIIGPSRSISAAVVASDSGAVGPTQVLGSSTTSDLTVPDVDGYGGRWIATWRRFTSGLGVSGVDLQAVALDAGGTSLALGSSTSVGGSFIATVRAPTMAYTPGRSWLGYYESIANPYLKVDAIDSASLASCNDGFFVSAFSQQRIVVATATSGGATSVETALAVWSDGFNVLGQRLQNHGTAGGYVNLAGGCGGGGTQQFSHAPGIGSSGLVCSLTALPPTALLTIFNLSPPSSTLSCGPCEWTPFAATATRPVNAGGASVEFPIPCLSSLIGAQFEVQWTTFDPSVTACALFPGLALSDRVLMTVDN